MRTAVFDLDGTLADTSGDLLAAANRTFAGLGFQEPLGPGDAATAFAGGRAMLRLGAARLGLGWGEAEVARAFDPFVTLYRDDLSSRTVIYPGAVAALEALAGQGWQMAVCTNKPEALARELLLRLDLARHFAALVGADTLPVRKPDPAPYRLAVEQAGGTVGQSFLLGDTVTDRDTARAAGVKVALVTFGPEGPGVAALQPDALMHHFDELPGLAEALVF